MIQAQAKLELGDAAAVSPELIAKLYELANLLHEFTSDMQVLASDGESLERFDPFSVADFNDLQRLLKSKSFGIDDGKLLLNRYYNLCFDVLAALGHWIAGQSARQSWQEEQEGDNSVDIGVRLQAQAHAGKEAMGLMAEHPGAKRVNATFYPEQETKDFRQEGEKNGGDDWSEGIPLQLFLWHDADAGEWVLEDFTNLDEKKENRAAGKADEPVPAALFEELNSKLRFPKGALFYRCPGEGSYRILRTTEPTTMADWLRGVAIAGLAIGLAVATAGASIPAQVVMIGSALAMAGAEGLDMAAEAEQGMLTSERVLVHGALIASCVLGSTSGALGIAKELGRLGLTGGKVVRLVAGLQVGADGICVAVFTEEAFEGLKAAADDPEGITFMRLMGFFLQMGMNGLMLYGMKGSALEASGMGEVSASEQLLNAESKEAMRVERKAPRKQRIKEQKATFDDGKVIEGRKPGETVRRKLATKNKMETGAKIGIDATPESIRVGTVRMEEHPNYSKVLDEVRNKGFEIVFEKGLKPSVEIIEIVDMKGNLLRVEKKLILGENMQYLDLEHELGHISQLEHLASNESGITATERMAEKPIRNGKVKLIEAPNQKGVLNSTKNKVTELHIRLVEFMRLFENGAADSLLLEHAKGVMEWRTAFHKVVFKEENIYELSTTAIWASVNFGELSELDRRFNEIVKSKGFKLPEPSRRSIFGS